MIFIRIQNAKMQDVVTFSPNFGVLVEPEALNLSPECLYEMVQLAYSHVDDEYLVEACCGGSGPLAGISDVTYEEYLELLDSAILEEASRTAKKLHTRARRRGFDSKRSQLVLEMLEGGVRYVCGVQSCRSTEDLTLDHIVPLSRGGSDDIANLRFLCRYHNGMKADSPERMSKPTRSPLNGA